MGVLVALLLLASTAAQVGHLSASSQALETSSVFIAKGLTALTWDGKQFISSYGITNVPLVTVSLDGKTVKPFAPSFVGKDEVYVAISEGKAGFPAGYLYVNFDPSIYVIKPDGSSVQLFSSPQGAQRISYVAFDTVGSWGNALLALDDNGLLWSIDSAGAAKVLDNFSNFGKGATLKPEGIAVAPMSFGALGGYLFITLEGAHRILAIPPNNASKVMTLFQFDAEQPERVIQIPPQSDLYAAEFDTGNMLRVPAANFSNYVGSLLVITEGEVEPFGSFNVLQPAGNNVTLTRIGMVAASPHFEAAAWVPTAASAGNLTSISGGGIATPVLAGGAALLVAVVVLAVFLVSRRGRRST